MGQSQLVVTRLNFSKVFQCLATSFLGAHRLTFLSGPVGEERMRWSHTKEASSAWPPFWVRDTWHGVGMKTDSFVLLFHRVTVTVVLTVMLLDSVLYLSVYIDLSICLSGCLSVSTCLFRL